MPKHSSSRKQQSRHDEGGESTWSEWVWSPEHGRYYCYRITRSGEHEYQWGNAETESHDAATPRQQADIPVDDITQGMENLEILGRADSDYTEGNYGDGGYDYAYRSPAGNSGEATHKISKSMPSRSKGKAVDYDSLQDSGGPEPEPEEAPPLDPFYGAKTETEEPNGYEVEIPTQNPELFPSGTSQSGDYHGSSRYGSNQPNGYDLNDATNAAPNYTAEETPAQDYAESSNDSAYAPYPSHSDGDAGSLTPTVTDDEQPLHISGTDGDHEQLDPRYKIEQSTRFEPGMIFKILWPEPFGGNPNYQGAVPTETKSFAGLYGEPFYVGIRRFVVVANDDGHCTCVPIFTYGGKGCNKWGVKPLKHGIIYGGHKAHFAANEPKLGFKEVKAKLYDGEKLQKESRVNYAKLVTVEHNVKVLFIGRIVKENMRTFKKAVDTCWVQKKHGQAYWNE